LLTVTDSQILKATATDSEKRFLMANTYKLLTKFIVDGRLETVEMIWDQVDLVTIWDDSKKASTQPFSLEEWEELEKEP
jgi:hypothetical protein